MSHYSRIKTQIADRESLVKALKDLGYREVEVHEEPVGLYGYRGDLRKDKAHVIVRRKHIGPVSNDLGFVLRPDGMFEAIISDYDRGQGLNPQWMNRLMKSYSQHAVLSFANAQGFTVIELSQEKDQETRILLRRTT